jgi:hypothetical protein
MTGTRDEMKKEWNKGKSFGVHGYDPAVVPEMAGIFYARGPQIRKGSTVGAIPNIHVYPLMAAILGLESSSDGDLSVLKPILKR